MAKTIIPLNDREIKASKPKDKDYKLFDGGGLFLLVTKSGSKLWRLKYRTPKINKEKTLSFGKYPHISLVQARELREKNKKLLAIGIDPMEKKKDEDLEEQQEEHLEKSQIHLVFYEWVKTLENAEGTIKRKISLFEKDLFPYLGTTKNKDGVIASSKKMRDITHPEILKAINEKKKTANEMARRLLSDCKTLWNYAIAYGYTDRNIIDIIPKNEKPKKNIKHYPKITDEKILGALLNDIENYKGHPIVKSALMLAPLVMLRAENLTKLKWEYVDLKKKLITIPRSLMKVKDPNLLDFKLPLTDKGIKILNEVKQFTGWGEWVFCAVRINRNPLDPAVINKAIRETLRYNDEEKGTKQTIHSFRGTFRSLTDTHQKEHNADFIVRERVLDHHENNQVVRAYTHKADYTEQMRELLEWWEQFLDGVKNG